MAKFLSITKTYRDKVNGNTYFSSRVYDNNFNVVVVLPFQYGYGDQSEYEVKQSLENLAGNYKEQFAYDVVFEKVENCKKKDVEKFGEVK